MTHDELRDETKVETPEPNPGDMVVSVKPLVGGPAVLSRAEIILQAMDPKSRELLEECWEDNKVSLLYLAGR